MRKIALIVGDISRSGGTERAAVNMVNAVSSKKNKFIIISVFSADGSTPFFQLYKQTYIVNLGYRKQEGLLRYGVYMKLKKDLERMITKSKIDIIIGTGHQFNCVIALLSSNIAKAAWEHFVYEAVPFSSRLIRRCLYWKLNKVILLTHSDKKRYGFIKNERKIVIHNSSSFCCDESANLKSNRIIIVGRLDKIKSLDSVIRVAHMVKKAIPDWKFDIFGEGDEKSHLLRMIKRYKLEGYVSLKGTTDDIKREYLNSSMILLTSLFEALPMVLVEAQTCGLPVIAFDCPNGPGEIITNGRNGYLISGRDEIMMAHRVVQLAKDDALSAQYSRAAKTDSKRFAWEIAVKKWDGLFDELLDAVR